MGVCYRKKEVKDLELSPSHVLVVDTATKGSKQQNVGEEALGVVAMVSRRVEKN